MKRNFFINSPLEKGDTGGCFDNKASIPLKAEFYKELFQKKLYENLVRTTPSAPVIKGEFFRKEIIHKISPNPSLPKRGFSKSFKISEVNE